MIKWNVFCGIVFLTAMILSGCQSLLLPKPADASHIYRLSNSSSDTNTATIDHIQDAFTIRIDRPNAPKALQGNDLLIVKEDTQLAIVDKAEWADSLPIMVQKSFLSEMNGRAKLIGVLPTSGARAQYRAHITIRNFEAKFDRGEDQAPLIIVDYLVTLSNASSRKLVGTQSFRSDNRALSNRVSDIVKSKSGANQQNLEKISDWLIISLSDQGS
ncbi:MAG: ABC-type transport auxiliary lipoprotein family protein [Maricaulaceae bacterium]